jgi:dTDP-glucose 4,6-dehydratase
MPLPEADLRHVLEHTRGLWPELRGARLFITGGTGFFGKWLLETLAHARGELALDIEAVALTRDPLAFARAAPALACAPGITLHAGSVTDFAPPAGTFTHVIHAATPNSAVLNDTRPGEILTTIIDGTRRVLDFAQQKGVGALLFTSSGAVYGPSRTPQAEGAGQAFAETSRSAPDTMNTKNAYAEGKRVAELLCAIAADGGLRAVVARCFAFVGPHLPLDAHFAVGNFIGNALRGESIVINGDGRAVRSYLHTADLAIALWTLLARGEAGTPYNVGSPQGVSIADLARTVAAVAAPATEIRVLGQSDGGMDYYVPDTARYDARFGAQTRIALAEAIRRTCDFHRRAP